MDSTQAMGLVLVALSAALLASHWQQRRDADRAEGGDTARQRFLQRQLRRRTLASTLVGLLGVALTVRSDIPPRPVSISIYLFGLILLTCWILCLGLIDLAATRRFRQHEQIDRLAAEFRRARLDPTSNKSCET